MHILHLARSALLGLLVLAAAYTTVQVTFFNASSLQGASASAGAEPFS